MPTPTAAPATPARSAVARVRLQTLGVLALALALRMLVVWDVAAQFAPGWLFQRGTEMGYLAQSLISGLGLSSPFGVPTGPTAFIAPGYPVLIAGVFRIFGAYTQRSEVVIMLLNVAANLVTIWLILHLSRRLFNNTCALLAGIFWAISLPLLWIPTIFWDTSIATALLLGLVALALRCRTHPSRGLWLFLGLYCAITGLINPALLVAVFAILAWAAFATWREHRIDFVLALVVFTAAFSPWPIRNARVFHAFIPLRTTVGEELWMGNRPNSTGFLDQTIFPSYNRHELNEYIQQGELAYTNGKARLAKQYILSHPGAFVWLSAKRFVRFWSGTGNSDGSLIYLLHAMTTTLLGLAGLWMLFRRRRFQLAILFALPLLLFPLPYYITHAEFRYRLLIDPLLTILAAPALVWLLTRRFPEPENHA